MFRNSLLWRLISIFLLSLGAGFSIVYLVESQRELEAKHTATLIAASHAKSLEKQLARSLAATYALATFLKQNGAIPKFETLAQELIDDYGGITNLQLAPKGIVSQIHPLKGNEKVLGYDLNPNPFAISAIRSRQLTLEGPINLIQGGLAVLGRNPVFLKNPQTGKEEFWGFTTALIKPSNLLQAVDIHGLIAKNYHFTLSTANPSGGPDIVFSQSSRENLKNTVSVKINIPKGKWTLSVIPKTGWHSIYTLTLEGLLVFLFSGAVSFLGYKHLRKTQELETKTNDYETIFNSAPALIIYKDDKNNLLRVNQAVADSLNLKPSEIEGKHTKEFYPEDYEKYYVDDLEVIRTGKPKLGIIESYQLNSGEKHWVRTDKVPYRDKNGNVIGVLLFAIDITEQKEAEIKMRESSRQLETANRDLEEFASIASHDLQEPLRKVIIFGDRLARLIPGNDEKGLDHLERMQGAALRMKSLIEALLKYTRVKSEKSVKLTDLNSIVQLVLEDLEARLKLSGGTVHKNDLPTIEADPFQMHQLFLNLIGNALKFHRPGAPPVVQIQSQRGDNNTYIIEIRDNGIGIDSRHREKIFRPLGRLHNRTAYEGTGIGLTICQKIVSRHRGTIEFRENPDVGVTFFITLPESQPKDQSLPV